MPDISHEELLEAYNDYLDNYKTMYSSSNIIKQAAATAINETPASEVQPVSNNNAPEVQSVY